MTTKFFSFGYRCSSAGILKQLSLKNESHPFDWIVSRLPIIKHCLETDFHFFIADATDLSLNYKEMKTLTYHYDATDPANEMYICDETVQYNVFYSTFPLSPYFISKPLSMPEDTYSYPLCLNHHDVLSGKDVDYFKRCIGRLNQLLEDPSSKKYLYIHPALSIHDGDGEYRDISSNLIAELLDFQRFLQTKYPQTFPQGLMFLPLKTQKSYPITDHYPQPVKEIYNGMSYTSDAPQCVIYEVYMNKDFVDAGEIFMRNAYIETDAIMECIRNHII